MRQGSDGCGCCCSILRPDNLWIAIFRQPIVFVFTILRIDGIVEATVAVLHLGEEVCLPFGFLQHVADAIAAFGNSKIIQRSHAGDRIHGKHQRVDQLSGVVGNAIVVAGLEMATPRGIAFSPMKGLHLSSDLSLNYLVTATHA